MKDEYDFSKGQRGKFYQPDAKLNFPIYLENEVLVFVERLATKKNEDVSFIVNQLLRSDMKIAEIME